MSQKPSSPICYAAEADDIYMGYAGRDELLSELQELLEAERAGTRVALVSRKLRKLPGYSELMRGVLEDEAHWCAMLSRQIARLGKCPSRKTGSFAVKALAISDPFERLAFLNRGQSWVVRKLEQLLPRVRDDALHSDLKAMADKHRTNIELAEKFLAKNPASRSSPD
ncbi:MAG: hypothetical protein CMH85_12645 [Novosphingobium sp.]|jgi:hypothetical protein|nr:hypothetical protein [Novosphingobium sp.]|tara:strand:+ start:348 stop:851 length:504 start_codon:yes stop_codon:yes gene_type:complete